MARSEQSQEILEKYKCSDVGDKSGQRWQTPRAPEDRTALTEIIETAGEGGRRRCNWFGRIVPDILSTYTVWVDSFFSSFVEVSFTYHKIHPRKCTVDEF